MEVSKYAVSVQYGKGHHHFVRTDIDTLAEAEEVATATERRKFDEWSRGTKRGNRPSTHVWARVTSFI